MGLVSVTLSRAVHPCRPPFDSLSKLPLLPGISGRLLRTMLQCGKLQRYMALYSRTFVHLLGFGKIDPRQYLLVCTGIRRIRVAHIEPLYNSSSIVHPPKVDVHPRRR